MVGKSIVSYSFCFRADPYHLLREPYSKGLLCKTRRRNGRPLGHCEHSRQERSIIVARKEQRGGYRPHSLKNQQKDRTGRVLQ